MSEERLPGTPAGRSGPYREDNVLYLDNRKTIDLSLSLSKNLGFENLEAILKAVGEEMFSNINTLDPVVRDRGELKKVNELNTPLYDRYKRLEIMLCHAERGKPIIPQLRPKNYFRPGDGVKVFVFEPFEDSARFESDRVEELTEHDYTQSVSLEENGSPTLSSFWLMHDWEFEYLEENKAFRGLWLDYSRPVVARADTALYAKIFQFFETILRKECGEQGFRLNNPRVLEGVL